MCGVESLEISKVVQTVLARLMEFKYGTGLLALCGWGAGRVGKGAMASAHPDARHFSLSLYTTDAFQAAPLVLELRWSESESVHVPAL